MRFLKKTILLLAASLWSLFAMGCAFTLPSPPELSRSIQKDGLSKSGTLMVEASAQAGRVYVPQGDDRNGEGAVDLRNSIAGDVVRCEKRLNDSVNKMNLQRTSKSALTMVGASLSTCAGIAAAILSNSKLVSIQPQTATSIVAAGGGLVTILTQAIGDPAGELQNYQRNLDHYNRAVAIAERIRLSNESQFFNSPDCKQTPTADTPECQAQQTQAEAAAVGNFQNWQAAEVRALSGELRACADTQGSTVLERPGGSDGDKDTRGKPFFKLPMKDKKSPGATSSTAPNVSSIGIPPLAILKAK